MNRNRLLLLLVIIFLAALWYAWRDTPRQQTVGRDLGGNDEVTTVQISREYVEEDLDFSGGDKLKFKPPKRDLFRPLYRQPVVTQVVTPPPPPAPTPELPKPVVAPPPPPPPPPPPQQTRRVKPIPVFRVLGFLEKDSEVTVFLAGTRGDIYLVKQGDRFDDDLLVKELDIAKIVISRGPDDPGVTLKVSEPKLQRLGMQSVPSGRPSVPEIEQEQPANPVPGAGQIGQ